MTPDERAHTFYDAPTAPVTYPLPSGWRAVCLVPTCGYTARGHDEADAEAALLEHLRLQHATVEPDQEPDR